MKIGSTELITTEFGILYILKITDDFIIGKEVYTKHEEATLSAKETCINIEENPIGIPCVVKGSRYHTKFNHLPIQVVDIGDTIMSPSSGLVGKIKEKTGQWIIVISEEDGRENAIFLEDEPILEIPGKFEFMRE